MSDAPIINVNDPRYPVKPSNINLDNELRGAFGRRETEKEGIGLIMACLEAGDRWVSFSPQALSPFLARSSGAAQSGHQLFEPEWLVLHRLVLVEGSAQVTYHVTHKFVFLAFERHPQYSPVLARVGAPQAMRSYHD